MNTSGNYLIAKDGTKLFYQCWQPGRVERTLLCIHGACCHSVEFTYLGGYLSSKNIVTCALDLRANGQSGGERGDLEDIRIQLDDMDEMVILLQEEWQKPIYVLGHSLGGSYALWYGSEHSERLAGLILAAPAIKPKMGPLGTPAPLSDLWRFPFYAVFRPSKKWDVSSGWPRHFRENEDARYILSDEKCVKEYSFRYLIGLSKIGGKAGLRLASKVNIPTLILQGTDDDMLDPKGAQTLYKSLATLNKEIRTFKGADHGLYEVFSPRLVTKVANGGKEEVCKTIHDWLIKF